MVPNQVQPRFETRLNLLSRRIFILLEEHDSIGLDAMSGALGAPADLVAVAVGWLARSRVVELNEDGSGRLQVKIRRSDE